MTQDIFVKLLNEHRELSSLPQVLVEVLRVSADPNSSASNLAAVIMKDPSLTAKLLRAVNSSFYGAVRKITTVNQAVVTLGQRTVTAIALSASVYDKMRRMGSAVDRKRFWRHSLETAIAARMIAENVVYEPAEEAFVAGLLHEIGTLVLEASFPNEFKRIWKLVEQGESQAVVEEKAWGTNHARVGQFLLDQWGIPKEIGAAVGNHHNDPEGESDAPDNPLSNIVNLANRISKFRVCNMPPPDAGAHACKNAITSALGLSHTALANIEEKLLSEVIRESEFLEIEIGNLEEILAEANNLLYRQFMTVENLLRENRLMQQQIARDQIKKAALESLKAIAGTFSHYINNATTTILGRAQLLEVAINKGKVSDPGGAALQGAKTIIAGVETISIIVDELRKLTTFETTVYHDDTYIINIEDKIKARLEELNRETAPQSK